MKSHALFGCICVLGMLRGVTSRSLPDNSDPISIEISNNKRFYEYSEGEQMSFNCTMKGGDERKANITFAIDGDQKKELFGVRHVTIEKDAEATDNQQYLRCDIWYKGNLSQATKLITVYYSPRVAAEDLDVNGTYIATGDFKVGQGANLTVMIRANPRPSLAVWKVNGNELDPNRFKPLTPDKFSFDNGSWVAALEIKKVEKSDFNDVFQLHVTNNISTTTILIKMKDNTPDESASWVLAVMFVVVAVGLSIIAYLLCTKKPHSTSEGNSVEDIQSTTSDTYILQGVKNQEQICKSCYDLANEVSSSKITIAIVEGASGMGKTKCLEEIQKHFHRKKPQWRVVNLSMRIFRDDFASNLSSTSEAVTLVASKLDLSNEEQRVFEDKAKAELVLYLFDDMDCLENSKLEAALEFFELLQKVIATTRKPFIVKQPYVEKYSLQPLDDAQQGKLMEKLGCSKSMGQEIKTLKRDFDLGVPLYLLMTAQNALLMNAELPEELVLTDIHKCFMENRVEKVLREKNEIHTKNDLEVVLHNLAISFAFHEESKQEDELSIRDLALTCVVNKRTHFTNGSIAEYLTASAVVKKLQEVPDSAKILLPTRNLSKLLVSDEFSTERYLANKIISHSSTTNPTDCSNFLEDLECDKSELAMKIIKERLFSLHKELARNGLRLDFDQMLQLEKGKETFPVIWAAMEAGKDSEISATSELFRFLTESGASLDSVENGETALSIAIKASNEPLVKFLLELGATMEIVHNCCLHQAAETGNLPLVEFFLSHYEVDVVNSEGVTPLMLAASKGNLQVVQFLISKGSNVNLEAANGNTSLHFAAQGGHVKVLKILVTKENVDSRNGNYKTPLIFSVEEKQLEAVKYLLSAGADAFQRGGTEGNTCLHIAAQNGWFELVFPFVEGEETKTLLNYQNKDNRTALHLAALKGQEKIVRYLLGKGVNPDKRDEDGNTPDMLATMEGHTNIAKMLMARRDSKISIPFLDS